jgi:hypothetical protein
MVALLIVHGIGQQRRGETTDTLLIGLKAAYGGAIELEHDAEGYPAAVTANGRTVRLYEVYWADILGGTDVRSGFTWDVPSALAWHPMWCRRLGLLRSPEYSAALVWWRVLTLVPLAPAGYLGYVGVRFFSQILDTGRRDAFEKTVRNQQLSFLERSRAYADFTAQGATRVDEILDSVIADAPNYMRSIVEGDGCAFAILQRFHAQMDRARQDGCDAVHVLAHSLGTVVAFHALTGVGQAAGQPAPAPLRLFTIGSPLEKVRFFWPWTLRAAQPSAHPDFQWVNFHHRADRVSGYLKRFAPFSRLQNVRLKGGGGLLRSHVVYQRSPEFLSVLTSTLFGAPAAPRVSRLDRIKDFALAWAENAVGVTAVALAIAVGAAFVFATILLPAYLISLPFRWLGGDVVGLRVQNGFALFTVFGMTVSMLLWVRDRCRDAKRVCERAHVSAVKDCEGV